MDVAQLKTVQNNFRDELTKAQNGEKTSLPYIVHQYQNPSLKNDEVFQIIVVGGSVFKKALARPRGNSIQVLSQEEKQQPVFKTQADFFSFIEAEIDPSVETIALNFAYPVSPVFRNGLLDGVLQSGSKENTFDGLVGKQIGSELEKYLQGLFPR